ncbi:Cysteine-rich secretory protein family protein [Cellulophaga tyrosinoxydans]|uniref:Cysteine-rich secretory protein family protein n=2 Tax=Cellulophaga tyrosinoxydans TaxID=504486 RepID=A0A1W1Z225_9FLAO|nr:Cysteine-rich secretory protein family protein [Cellulophaga tyrosinoxydans]
MFAVLLTPEYYKMRLAYTIFVTLLLVLNSCTKDVFEVTILEETGLENASSNEMELFKLINDHRIAIGKNSLVFNSETYIAASEHSAYMVSQGKLSHDNFNLRASKIEKKTKAKNVSENVAKEYVTNEATLEAWLKSPKHKKNIEGNYTHSALSIKQDVEGNYYFTQIFFN